MLKFFQLRKNNKKKINFFKYLKITNNEKYKIKYLEFDIKSIHHISASYLPNK